MPSDRRDRRTVFLAGQGSAADQVFEQQSWSLVAVAAVVAQVELGPEPRLVGEAQSHGRSEAFRLMF